MSVPFAQFVSNAARSDEVARPTQARRQDGLQAAWHRCDDDIAFVRRTLALQQVNVKFPIQREPKLNTERRR